MNDQIKQLHQFLFADGAGDDDPLGGLTDREVAEMAEARFNGADRFEICDEFGIEFGLFVALEKTERWQSAYEDAETEFFRRIEAKARREIEAGIEGNFSNAMRVAERMNRNFVSPPQKGDDPKEWPVTGAVHAEANRRQPPIDTGRLSFELVKLLAMGLWPPIRANLAEQTGADPDDITAAELYPRLPDDIKQLILDDLAQSAQGTFLADEPEQ